MNCEETRQWLGAHRDGELDLVSAAEVDQHLQRCADCTALARGRDTWTRALATAAPRYAPSENLQRNIEAMIARESRRENRRPVASRSIWQIFVGVTALAAMLVLGFELGARHEQAALFSRDLISRHTLAMNSDHLTEVVSSDRHTVKPWLAQHLDFSPPVVDLAVDGFPLNGARIENVGTTSIAALVYHRHAHVITVYVWPRGALGLPATEILRGFHVQPWQQGEWNFVAISDVAGGELSDFAEKLRRSIGAERL